MEEKETENPSRKLLEILIEDALLDDHSGAVIGDRLLPIQFPTKQD